MSTTSTKDADNRSTDDNIYQDQISANALLAQCQTLLKELTEFESLYIASQGSSSANDIRPLRNAVASELKSLERLSKTPTTPQTLHTLRSSNLPFLVAVWTTAKQHTGIVAFQKRFYRHNGPPLPTTDSSQTPSSSSKTVSSTPTRDHSGHSSRPVQRSRSKPKKHSALVDVVADTGALWIKVSTISASRLLFELAKAGWEGESDSEDEWDGGKVNGLAGASSALSSLDIQDEQQESNKENTGGYGVRSREEAGKDEDSDEEDGPELVRTAVELARAARSVRVRYKHPELLFVLPKLQEGVESAVDGILADIRATGARVICGSYHSPQGSDTPTSNQTSAQSGSSFEYLLPTPVPTLTQTLNLDCTILLALASDLSHRYLEPTPDLHPAIQRQITLESSSPLLPNVLYPALASRDLVAAPAAVRRMREIVSQIGTPDEKTRAETMFPASPLDSNPDLLLTKWTQTSVHPVPEGLKLPVQIIDDGEDATSGLPRDILARIESEVRLSEVNRGTLWLGWRRGWVTVSSNRVVVRDIEKVVESWLDEQQQQQQQQQGSETGEQVLGEEMGVAPGPRVWTVGVARSLVGKDVGRMK